MPDYKLPVRKKPKKSTGADAPCVGGYDWMRQISIPANKAIIDALEVGKPVTVKLTGTVVALSQNEDDQQSRAEFRIDVDEVEAEAGEGGGISLKDLAELGE